MKKVTRKKTSLELYDLSKDPGEKKNLAGSHPAMVKELDHLLQNHATSIAANLRPAGFAKNPKPILKEVGDLPTLKEYLEKVTQPLTIHFMILKKSLPRCLRAFAAGTLMLTTPSWAQAELHHDAAALERGESGSGA